MQWDGYIGVKGNVNWGQVLEALVLLRKFGGMEYTSIGEKRERRK